MRTWEFVVAPPPPDGAPVLKSKVPIRKKSALILAKLRSARFALKSKVGIEFPRLSCISKVFFDFQGPHCFHIGEGKGGLKQVH